MKIQQFINDEYADKIYEEFFIPTVYYFVSWVLKKADRAGIKRLYFLARDMWQCEALAEKLSQ